MSYTVKFRDKTERVIDEERGLQLKQILSQPKPPTMIEIDDRLTRTSEIVTIDKNYDFQTNDLQITAGNWDDVGLKTCHGTNSIQNHINQIGQDLDVKLLKDDAWREKTRQQLRKQAPEGWCDYKEDECVCT